MCTCIQFCICFEILKCYCLRWMGKQSKPGHVARPPAGWWWAPPSSQLYKRVEVTGSEEISRHTSTTKQSASSRQLPYQGVLSAFSCDLSQHEPDSSPSGQCGEPSGCPAEVRSASPGGMEGVCTRWPSNGLESKHPIATDFLLFFFQCAVGAFWISYLHRPP